MLHAGRSSFVRAIWAVWPDFGLGWRCFL
jgi:hypothetical protein